MAMPKRELFKAPEVCELTQVQPYVLRTWEAEFPTLGQKSGNGTRVYRRADIEKVLQIKQLVYGEGLTLAGARRRLEEKDGAAPLVKVDVDDVFGNMARSRLRAVKSGLEAILKMLGEDTRRTPELQLVPPVAKRAAKPAAKPAAKRRRTS
jgi:DNA-binding transcriptional MerR regulator